MWSKSTRSKTFLIKMSDCDEKGFTFGILAQQILHTKLYGAR